MIRHLLVLPFALCLTACLGSKTTTLPIKLTWPAVMFQCQDAPSAKNVDDQTGLALYINGLHLAYQDCKTRLRNIEGTVNK